ncbi:hypothetical protein WJX77_007975 [Trebouxia sp. C0004]
MMEAKTNATALQNSALHAGRQQDAALISELHDVVEELIGTAAKQAATIAAQAATTNCLSAVNNNSAQGLRLSDGMLGAKLKATALQSNTLVAGRQQDAVRMQHLVDADTQLRATIAQQAVTIAEQAEVIHRQKSVMAQTDRRISISSKLLSKLWGRRKVEAIDLEHLDSDSHVELLKSEKQGLKKTLEETEDELAKERQRTERAWAQAQHRATKRQEVQEARDEEEYVKNQMHAKWVQALKEIDILKAAMVSGHFLFEALMKVPCQASVSTNAEEQIPAAAEEDTYV